MEETTTSDSGATSSDATAQPQQDEAVTEGNEQVITKDSNGTPSLEPITNAPSSADDAASETIETKEAQADDITEWATKKGLPLDDPKKLASMYRDAEKKMHEATEAAKQLETATVQTLDYTGDENRDELAASVNQLLVQNSVRDFFSANPEAREFEPQMAEIVLQRPHLKNDLDALYALARSDPNREADLKQQGGRDALQSLAQKQQQVPPASGATNSAVYESSQITSSNVYDLIDKNDQAWFQKNYAEINKAISG